MHIFLCLAFDTANIRIIYLSDFIFIEEKLKETKKTGFHFLNRRIMGRQNPEPKKQLP